MGIKYRWLQSLRGDFYFGMSGVLLDCKYLSLDPFLPLMNGVGV